MHESEVNFEKSDDCNDLPKLLWAMYIQDQRNSQFTLRTPYSYKLLALKLSHTCISSESYIPLSFLVSVFYSRNIENFIPISSRQRETRESLGRLNEWNNVYSRLHNSSPHSLSCSSKLSLLFLSLERPQKINSSVSYMQSVYTCIGPCPPRLLYTH